MVGRIMAPKDDQVITPAIYKDVISHGKNDHAGVINSRIWRWGNHPGLSGWAQCNPKGA